jgi:LmbE family N-acetylglucosaminyl deacetylase
MTWHLKGDHVASRRLEDVNACRFMGCGWHHLEFQDCIYRYLPGSREPLIHKFAELSSPIHEQEYPMIDSITARLKELFPENARFLAPLGIGGHVDHRITRAVAERLGGELYLYLDFPYSRKEMEKYQELLPAGARSVKYTLSEEGIKAWQKSIGLYPSQLRSFWKSTEEMEKRVREFAESPLGSCYWKV